MKKIQPKHRLVVLILAVFLAGGFLLLPLHNASAQGAAAAAVVGFLLDNVGSNAVFTFVGWIVQLVNSFVGALLLPLAASILGWVFTAGEFTRAEVVEKGWAITRDLANMGFILVLLVIGFATILRYQEGTYGVKALLPKLILAALLINFSLVIAGVFIDVGNDLAIFFVSGGEARAGDIIRVDGSLINAMKARSILAFDQDELAAALAQESEPQIKILIRHIAQLAITLIITFLFFAIALLLVFRMVYLWILLILAPFAWLALAIPKSSYWNKWWNEFIKWALVPAVIGFFIYIAVLAGRSFAAFGGTYVEGLQESQTLPFQVFHELLSFVAVVIILGYGVTVAPAWGGAGAVTAMKWAGKARDWSLGYVGRKGARFGGQLAQATMYGKDEKGQRTKPRLLIKGLTYVPGFRQVLKAPIALAEQRRKQISEAEGKYDKLSTEHLETLYRGASLDDRIAIDRVRQKRSQFVERPGVISKKEMAATMKRAIVIGMGKELILSAADIAVEFNVIPRAQIKDMVVKARPSDIEKMSAKVLENLKSVLGPAEYATWINDIVGSWRGGHIGKIIEKEQFENLNEIQLYIYEQVNPGHPTTLPRDQYISFLQTLNPGLVKYFKDNPIGQELLNDLTYVTP